MNLGDTADLGDDLLNKAGYRTDGATTISSMMTEERPNPGILTKVVGKELSSAELGPVAVIVPDDNVVSDILEGRSYEYADGNYQRPEQLLSFFDEIAASDETHTPELAFPSNIIPRLKARFGGEEYLNFRSVINSLEDMGQILETGRFESETREYGSMQGDAMICYAAEDFVPERGYALVMTNDDHFPGIAEDFDSVYPASPVYAENVTREKGLL